MPDAPSLCFTSVSVDRLFGVDHGIQLDGLCEGVNVICGPNASGKTTVARAMQALLWPDEARVLQPVVSAQFRHDGHAWYVALEGRRHVCQQNGAKASRPVRLPASHADRYHLYLPDLLNHTNGTASFADEILREAGGGFDVEAAAEALGFAVNQPTRRKREARAAKEARAALEEAKTRRAKLVRDQEALDGLREEEKAAQRAAQRAAALRQALDVEEKRRALEKARQAVDAFPARLADVRPDDAECLAEYDERIAKAEATIAEAEQDFREAQDKLHQNHLTQEGLPDGLLETLSAEIEALVGEEQRVRDECSRLEEAWAAEAEAWTEPGFGLSKAAVADLELPALSDLEEITERIEMLKAKQAARDYLEEIAPVNADASDPDALRKGLEALQRWLRTGTDPDANSSRWPWAAVIVGGVLTFIGAVLLSQTAGPALVLSAAVLAVGLFAVIAAAVSLFFIDESSREQDLRRSDYERLGLKAPRAWTPEAVRRRADVLLDALRTAEIETEKKSAWARWENRWGALDESLAEAQRQRADCAHRIGLDGEGIGGESLRWLVERLAAWQNARRAVSAREAALAEAEEVVSDRLARINERLAPCGLDGADGRAAARARREQLANAQIALENAKKAISNAQKHISAAQDDKNSAQKKRSDLFERLELDTGEAADVEVLCDQYAAYQEAVEEKKRCTHAYETALQLLEEHPGFEAKMAEWREPVLRQEREEAQAKADDKEAISKKINRIEQRIEQAEEGREIEEKQAAHRRALDALRRERANDYEKAAGRVLADLVQEQTRDRDLPPVFARARELFARITNGRYRLALDRRAPAFRAVDVHSGRGLALDALSSGTKVQLLLAVRVAFVDSQERSCKLPLVLDEALANSDDGKAAAVIEALRTIAADGRQIFYLTAQEDEVAKWHRALTNGGLPFHLATLDDRSAREWSSAPAEETVVPVVPSPLDEIDDVHALSHAEYRERIDLPHWSPRQEIGALHLWYVLDDVLLLHRLAVAGIATWGALRTMNELAGLPAVGMNAETFSGIEIRAAAVSAWREAWHIGRGKIVDRPVLEAADGITDNFIDDAATLADELGGDGEALVRNLRDGTVRRFRTDQADRLHAFLTENGYLDIRDRLTPKQMWPHVVAKVDGRLSLKDLRQLFERFDGQAPKQVPEGAGGS